MQTQQQDVAEPLPARKFSSSNRVLARSFRISRDKWRDKHQRVQAELEQTRQLARERDVSRELWRRKCEDAQAQAAAALSRVQHLEHLAERCGQLEAQLAAPKK